MASSLGVTAGGRRCNKGMVSTNLWGAVPGYGARPMVARVLLRAIRERLAKSRSTGRRTRILPTKRQRPVLRRRSLIGGGDVHRTFGGKQEQLPTKMAPPELPR